MSRKETQKSDEQRKKTWELKLGLPSVPSQELPNLLHRSSTLMTSGANKDDLPGSWLSPFLLSADLICKPSMDPYHPKTKLRGPSKMFRPTFLATVPTSYTMHCWPKGSTVPNPSRFPCVPSSWKAYPHPSPRSTLTPGSPILLLALLYMNAPCPSVHCASYTAAGSRSSLRTRLLSWCPFPVPGKIKSQPLNFYKDL